MTFPTSPVHGELHPVGAPRWQYDATRGVWDGYTPISSVEDDNFSIVDQADPTKRFRWEASAIAAGNTRVLTVPDRDMTLGDAYTINAASYTSMAPLPAYDAASDRIAVYDASTGQMGYMTAGAGIVAFLDAHLGGTAWRSNPTPSFDSIADTGSFVKMTPTERAKLAGIEAAATADQTGSEIVALVDGALGSTAWRTSSGGLDVATMTGTGVGGVALLELGTAEAGLYAYGTQATASNNGTSGGVWIGGFGGTGLPLSSFILAGGVYRSLGAGASVGGPEYVMLMRVG